MIENQTTKPILKCQLYNTHLKNFLISAYNKFSIIFFAGLKLFNWLNPRFSIAASIRVSSGPSPTYKAPSCYQGIFWNKSNHLTTGCFYTKFPGLCFYGFKYLVYRSFFIISQVQGDLCYVCVPLILRQLPLGTCKIPGTLTFLPLLIICNTARFPHFFCYLVSYANIFCIEVYVIGNKEESCSNHCWRSDFSDLIIVFFRVQNLVSNF